MPRRKGKKSSKLAKKMAKKSAKKATVKKVGGRRRKAKASKPKSDNIGTQVATALANAMPTLAAMLVAGMNTANSAPQPMEVEDPLVESEAPATAVEPPQKREKPKPKPTPVPDNEKEMMERFLTQEAAKADKLGQAARKDARVTEQLKNGEYVSGEEVYKSALVADGDDRYDGSGQTRPKNPKPERFDQVVREFCHGSCLRVTETESLKAAIEALTYLGMLGREVETYSMAQILQFHEWNKRDAVQNKRSLCDYEGRTYSRFLKTPGTGTATKSGSKTGGSGSKRTARGNGAGICYEWQKDGTCSRRNCRFSHPGHLAKRRRTRSPPRKREGRE